MLILRNDAGGVAFEFIFLTIFLGLVVWLTGEIFQIFRASHLARVALETIVDSKLQEAGWPVCLEDGFDPVIRKEISLRNKYAVLVETILYVEPICRQEQ